MKILSLFTSGTALLLFGGQPSPAQNQPSPPPAPVASPATPPIPDGPPLETRVFEVMPDFLSKGSGPTDPADPFASDPRNVRPTYKTVLEQLGIEFTAPGSKVSHGPGRREITITNTKEQLDNVDSILNTGFGAGPPRQIQIHLEVFSLPPLTARKALMTNPKETGLYAWLDTELSKPDSSVKLERHSITIVRGGQRSKTEGINEITGATKFLTGPTPHSTSPSSSAAASTTFSIATPQAFVTRNAGDTFEVEMTLGDDGRSVDLNMAPETTSRLGIVKSGPPHDIPQPVYQTQKFAGQASGLIGQPMLISTFSPPVNTGVPGGHKEDRTWLLFVTVQEPEKFGRHGR